MILHVLWHPDPNTLSQCQEFDAADEPPLAPGRQRMTPTEHAALCAAEIAAGWAPPLDPPPMPTIPAEVTARQFFRALDQAALLDDIEAFVAQQPRIVQIDFNKSQVFQRDNPVLLQMAEVMGITPEQVDDVFLLAATL